MKKSHTRLPEILRNLEIALAKSEAVQERAKQMARELEDVAVEIRKAMDGIHEHADKGQKK